jgi:arsenite-transporting ATPase
VGKTTCSSALALQLVKSGKKTLLISTDPAHNLGDAFGMEFDGTPKAIAVPGAPGSLFALEVDPTSLAASEMDGVAGGEALSADPMVAEFKQWLTQIPGVDEAMALSSILHHVQDYDVIVFDTAPTGHTIRLLQLPAVLKAGIEKLESWKARLGGLLGNISSMLGGGGEGGAADKAAAMARLYERLKHYHARIEQLAEMFRDNSKTKFVCVCIAQYLSVYETCRLMGELHSQHIACEHVVVNMLMPCNFAPLAGLAAPLVAAELSNGSIATEVNHALELVGARARIQKSYIEQLYDAVGERATIVRLPLLPREVRGVEPLLALSQNLVARCERLHAATLDSLDGAAAASASASASASAGASAGAGAPLTALMNTLLAAKAAAGEGGAAAGDAAAAAPAAPLGDAELAESFAKLQKTLFAPGGIARVLRSAAITACRAEAAAKADDAVLRFFQDIEGPAGLFGALPHLGNAEVMSTLKAVAPAVLAELESEAEKAEEHDDGEDMYD